MSEKKEIRAVSSNGAKSYYGFYQELDGSIGSIEMCGVGASNCSQAQIEAHKKAGLYIERGEIKKAVELLETCFEEVFSPLQTRQERYKLKNSLSSVHIFKSDRKILNIFKEKNNIKSDHEALKIILSKIVQ